MFDEVEVQIKEAEAALKELSGEWDMGELETGIAENEVADEEKPLFENLFDKKKNNPPEEGCSRSESWKDVVMLTTSGSSCGSPNLSPRADPPSTTDPSNDKQALNAPVTNSPVDKDERKSDDIIRQEDSESAASSEPLHKDPVITEEVSLVVPLRLTPVPSVMLDDVVDGIDTSGGCKVSNPEIDLAPGHDLYLDLPDERNQLMDSMSCSSSVFSYPGSPTSGGAGGPGESISWSELTLMIDHKCFSWITDSPICRIEKTVLTG